MKRITSLRLLLAAGLSAGLIPQAFAAVTLAGTTVSNTASVEYDVGGVAQDPVDSNASTFVVDRKVDVTVLTDGPTTVVPGTTRTLTFTVTNKSNSPMDFSLAAANQAGDNFQVGSILAYVESGANAGYQAGEDSLFIDELAPDDDVTVTVVATIPLTAKNTEFALVSLIATAAQSVDTDGSYLATPGTLAADAAQSNVGLVDDSTYIDTVFADAAGPYDGPLPDGKHSDDGRFNVETARLNVTKTSVVVSDPVNCSGTPVVCASAPKAIPGAVIEYCLDVNNIGASDAESIVLTDGIPANTTYVPESIKTGATSTTNDAVCDVGSGTAQTDAAGGDGEYSTSPAPRGSVIIRSSTIPSLNRFRALFRVTVD